METEIQVAPVEFQKDENDFNVLEKNCTDVFDRIKLCDAQVLAWQSRKKDLQLQLSSSLSRIQKQFGNLVEDKRVRDSKSVRTVDLILDYLEKNGPSKTSEIRKFLLENGKKTSPGVALGKMVKDHAIENVERGLYKKV